MNLRARLPLLVTTLLISNVAAYAADAEDATIAKWYAAHMPVANPETISQLLDEKALLKLDELSDPKSKDDYVGTLNGLADQNISIKHQIVDEVDGAFEVSLCLTINGTNTGATDFFNFSDAGLIAAVAREEMPQAC